MRDRARVPRIGSYTHMVANHAQELIGTVVDGRYRIDEFIARGGMATVFRATDSRLDRVVALKVMHGTLAEDEGFVARFVREARSAAQLNHPAIVAVFDQGEADGLVYLAMEYVDGETLRDVLTRQGRLPAYTALGICEPVLEALTAAHQAGFAHRDIKPENVLIATDGRVKVADFGLARAIATSTSTGLTQGLLIGTVAYLAPEQVESGTADTRTDVYAAGIVLYESVVGQPPFTGETPMSVAYQHVHSQVPVPSSIRSDIPVEIDKLVAISTAQNPADRYVDAADFAQHLRAIRVGLEDIPAPLGEGHHTVVLDRSAHTVANGPHVTEPSSSQPTAAVAALGTAIAPSPDRAGMLGPPNGPWVQEPPTNGGEAAASPPGDQGTPATTSGPRQPRRFRVLAAAIVLALIAATAGVGAWAWTQAQLVTVPNVVGMTPKQAAAQATATGLSFRVVGQDFSSKVAKGKILATDPEPGSQIRSGDELSARVSAGPRMVIIPKVEGKPEAEANIALQRSGFTAKPSYEYSDFVEEGVVVDSTPEAGKRELFGSAVELIVSKGPPPVVVPDVVTMDQGSAVAALEAAGLKVVVINQLPVVVVGRVYSQDPAPGTTVTKGTTITITMV